jgi:hypothetical protein
MQLWLLQPVEIWEPWYDKAFGFVVRAESEDEARRFASAKEGDEGKDVWLDPTLTTCEPLVAGGEPGIILRDFWSA